MRTYAASVIVALASATVACAAQPKVPDNLIGRWIAVEMRSQGKPAPKEVQLELEFTPTQMYMRLSTLGETRAAEPKHIFDCRVTSEQGRMILDLKTAANSPGPEKGLHARALFEVSGDTLRMCSNHSDDPKTPGKLPKDFVSSPENANDLLILERTAAN